MAEQPIKQVNSSAIGTFAASIAVAEIGLGSILHSMRVPFTGTFLSLNQGFFLARYLWNARNHPALVLNHPAMISFIVALLKTLAPAGKKLSPMLAISVQGLLTSVGYGLCACRIPGIYLGGVLAALWSFIQPALLYLLVFGKRLMDVAAYYVEKLAAWSQLSPAHIWYGLSAIILLKVTLAIGLTTIAIWLPEQQWQKYLGLLSRMKIGTPGSRPSEDLRHRNPYLMAAVDLLNPLFLLLTAASLLMFYFAEEESMVLLFYLVGRPIVAGYFLFLFLRLVPLARWVQLVNRFGSQSLSTALVAAMEHLRTMTRSKS